MQAENSRPPVLCIGGLDPSGGAGLEADIEAVASCGGHALPIASCLTVQNSVQTFSVSGVDPQLIQQQAHALIDDMPIVSCKIGVVPNKAIISAIREILTQLPNVPVVFDPVLSASHGSTFSNADTINAIKEILLPVVTVITPNLSELATLTDNNDDITSQAKALCQLGVNYVLATGADSHQDDDNVHNTLFNSEGMKEEYQWPRLPNSYHGSGCTLSSALACFLALGLDMSAAVNKAQQFTWRSLQNAQQIGSGQWIPKRIDDANC
ncbi:MAG: hydroxymethylpyrimidine/phosphomethylpyrimidine kinase [Gammaproteobacteria bacterium]